MERIKHRKITRNRELRACTECRRRKQKCDRRIPCTSCTKRNEVGLCIYEKNLEGHSESHGSRLQAEARLEHLERLVQELSQSQQIHAGREKSILSTNTLQRSQNGLPNDSLYSGATHWVAMLEDIDELRTAIRGYDEPDDTIVELSSDGDDGMGLLFGATNALSFQQIISHFLPPRHQADRLVATYFRAKAVAAPFVHAAHFQRLYQSFWDDLPNASSLWTSILFSIFDIATRTLSTTSKTSTDANTRMDRFAIAAAYCLAIGKYYKPQRFAVEALLLFAQSRCITSAELSPDLGVLLGTLARLATIMGYHREADESRAGISAFEREMRRRTWSIFMQLDMLVSFQLGLPSNVQFPTWNTRLPANLLDSDFDEDTAQLPSARPDSEPTEVLFYVAKHRLMAVFEKVIRHTLAAVDRPSNELELIEQELRDTYAALPDIFRPRFMVDSIVDSPSVIVTRLCVCFIYQKCLCVLHRKYIILGRQESIQICQDSASDLVRRFLDIYKEFEPGGQLQTERWLMGSITWNDFLLGCTTLCLTACSVGRYAAELADTATVDVVGTLELLRRAKTVCEKQSNRSRDTRKVQRLAEVTILRFSSQDYGGIPTTEALLNDGQDAASDAQWQTILSTYGDKDWLSNENTTAPLKYSAWEYMEQFLDLPNDDFMTIT